MTSSDPYESPLVRLVNGGGDEARFSITPASFDSDVPDVGGLRAGASEGDITPPSGARTTQPGRMPDPKPSAIHCRYVLRPWLVDRLGGLRGPLRVACPLFATTARALSRSAGVRVLHRHPSPESWQRTDERTTEGDGRDPYRNRPGLAPGSLLQARAPLLVGNRVDGARHRQRSPRHRPASTTKVGPPSLGLPACAPAFAPSVTAPDDQHGHPVGWGWSEGGTGNRKTDAHLELSKPTAGSGSLAGRPSPGHVPGHHQVGPDQAAAWRHQPAQQRSRDRERGVGHHFERVARQPEIGGIGHHHLDRVAVESLSQQRRPLRMQLHGYYPSAARHQR